MKVISLVGPSATTLRLQFCSTHQVLNAVPLQFMRQEGGVLADEDGSELDRFHSKALGDANPPTLAWTQDPAVGLAIVSPDIWVANTDRISVLFFQECMELRERYGIEALRRHVQGILEGSYDLKRHLLLTRVCPAAGIHTQRMSPAYKAGINGRWIRALLPT